MLLSPIYLIPILFLPAALVIRQQQQVLVVCHPGRQRQAILLALFGLLQRYVIRHLFNSRKYFSLFSLFKKIIHGDFILDHIVVVVSCDSVCCYHDKM